VGRLASESRDKEGSVTFRHKLVDKKGWGPWVTFPGSSRVLSSALTSMGIRHVQRSPAIQRPYDALSDDILSAAAKLNEKLHSTRHAIIQRRRKWHCSVDHW